MADPGMTAGTVLAGRYELLRPLGPDARPADAAAGGPAETWLARDGDRQVVVKLLSMARMPAWKPLELLEREAEVLKGIRHPGIPAFIDSFRVEGQDGPVFAVVRAYIPGLSLQERVQTGWRATEAEIMRIGAGLAGITAYIHAVRPPVIHRDINPNNVIMGEAGEIFLVDFGGVQAAAAGNATTVIGTPGYAAFEQFVGRATPRSDLYGVAATLLFLLTHRNPADLPARGMKPDWRSSTTASPGLARVLDSWLEPDEGMRSLSEDEAAALLEAGPGASVPPVPAAALSAPPMGTRITVTRDGEEVLFRVPERGRGRGAGLAGLGAFSVFWLVFVAFWTFASTAMRAPLAFTLLSLPFWCIGLFLAYRVLTGLFGTVSLSLERGWFRFTRRLFFLSRSLRMPLSEVGECTVEESTGRSAARGTGLRLEAGARVLRFGEQLSDHERDWLGDLINDSIRRLRV